MENYYWYTEDEHENNEITMCDWIAHHNTELEITFVDGTYAEGIDKDGFRWEIHASGNGDFNHHKIEFIPFTE